MVDEKKGGGGRGKPAASKLKLEISVDEPVAQGVYSNGLMVNVSETEVTLDFLYVQPAQPRAKVRSRVIVSPVQAKRMIRLLGENLKRFEERFGAVREAPRRPSKDPSPDGGGGGGGQIIH